MYTLIQQYERALEVDRERELSKAWHWRESADERLDKIPEEAKRPSNTWWRQVVVYLALVPNIFP